MIDKREVEVPSCTWGNGKCCWHVGKHCSILLTEPFASYTSYKSAMALQ